MKKSSGILVYRKNKKIEVFLVHPGGPLWKNKDLNSWSIPKGEVANQFQNKYRDVVRPDILLDTGLREFKEETGIDLKEDKNKIFYLGEVRNPTKILHVFVLEKNLGNIEVRSNLIKIEYLGKKIKIPEVDKGEYFDLETAKEKLVSYQKEIIEKLKSYLEVGKNI